MKTASATAEIPDISEVSPLSDADRPMVDEIVGVLRKHNALNRFGLTLVHKHFEVADDEVMVESTDVQSRTQTIVPVKKSELPNLDYTETSWRLDTGAPMMACVCIKFGSEHSHQSRG